MTIFMFGSAMQDTTHLDRELGGKKSLSTIFDKSGRLSVLEANALLDKLHTQEH